MLGFTVALLLIQDKPPEAVKLAWNVKKTVACAATWKYSSTVEETKDKTKTTAVDKRGIEMNLVPDNDKPTEGGFKVIITKATLVRETDDYKLTVTYEEGKPATDAWTPKSKKDGVDKEVSEVAAYLKKIVASDYALGFGSEGIGCSVWVAEKTKMADPIFGTEREVPPGWMSGSGAPSILNPCGFTLKLPATEIKSGQTWELGYSTVVGKKPVKMKVASLTNDAATLTAQASGAGSDDVFGDGKIKKTLTEKIDDKVVFSLDGYLLSASHTYEDSEKTDSKEAFWKGSKKTKTTSEFTLRRK